MGSSWPACMQPAVPPSSDCGRRRKMHRGASWRGAAGCEGACPRELARALAKIIRKFCILDSESREPSRALSLKRQWHLCPLPFPSSQRNNATQPLQCNDQWQLLGTPPHAGPGLRWAGLGLTVTVQPQSGQL